MSCLLGVSAIRVTDLDQSSVFVAFVLIGEL